jgi:pimeloyl-ACP methyl ester carboxylesterase
LLKGLALGDELARVDAPTLIVTGDPALERVVPVRLTREYLGIWPQARFVTIARTGHLGLITRPDEFTGIVAPFVADTAAAVNLRRHVG